MQSSRLPLTLNGTLALFMLVLTTGPCAWSTPKYKVLHAFGAGKDGAGLWSSVLFDRKGNLYGTTSGGGSHGVGTVFKLTPHADGKWTETLLHNFNGNDGGGVFGGLVFGAAGDLYGTTQVGGGSYTYGTVFEMKPSSNGWTFSVIHRFGQKDPANGPYGGVVMDQPGNLYGVGGWAFELSPGSEGWKESLLHAFDCQHGDGCGALARPIPDAAGNLYGTTEHGGNQRCGGGCGTVYEVQHMTDGTWKETLLHDFYTFRGDGAGPGVGALVIDSAGNLYGSTDGGGSTGYGTVFKLTPGTDGHWKETILHNFAGDANGGFAAAGVVRDQAGNLYGTTIAGGSAQCGCGVVYKLAPAGNGKWKYTVLHRFTGYDGAEPDANLILDRKGNIYGTTATGGAGGFGVAFEITP